MKALHTFATCALLVASSAHGQHASHGPHAPPSPYASMQSRDIKALSPQQVDDLRQGRGMGASLPAELNGAPGPLHALQLAEQLGITPTQHAALERITQEMRATAQALGSQILAAEARLDRGFANGAIDEEGVRQAAQHIGALQGELRATHLVAHLKTRAILTREQVASYNQARGYASLGEPTTRRMPSP